ncbi:MAG: hypothetical protein ACRYFX_18570 [Janthinobacterium lividum]
MPISDAHALRQLVKAVYPTLLADVRIELPEDGRGGDQEMCYATLHGPGLLEPVEVQGLNGAEIMAALKRVVGKARRAFAVDVDMRKILNRADFTPEEQDEMREMLTGLPNKWDYEKMVAKYQAEATTRSLQQPA